MTPEQKVQLRSMAVDLAVRSGGTPVAPQEQLLERADAIYNFIMTDVEAKVQQAAKVVSLV